MKINQETHYQPEGKPLQVVNESWDMQIYTRPQIEEKLSKTGYRLHSVYGGFDEKKGLVPFKKDSPFIVVLAERE